MPGALAGRSRQELSKTYNIVATLSTVVSHRTKATAAAACRTVIASTSSAVDIGSQSGRCPLGSAQHCNELVLFRRALRVSFAAPVPECLNGEPQLIDQHLAVADLPPFSTLEERFTMLQPLAAD